MAITQRLVIDGIVASQNSIGQDIVLSPGTEIEEKSLGKISLRAGSKTFRLGNTRADGYPFTPESPVFRLGSSTWQGKEIKWQRLIDGIWTDFWSGVVSTMIIYANQTVDIKAFNRLEKLNYGKGKTKSGTGKNPAIAIEEVLLETGLVASDLNEGSFDDAELYFSDNSITIDYSFENAHNIKAMTIIQRLCEATNCDLYRRDDNKLFLSACRAFKGGSERSLNLDEISRIETISYVDFTELITGYDVDYDGGNTQSATLGVNPWVFNGAAGEQIVMTDQTTADTIGQSMVDRFGATSDNRGRKILDVVIAPNRVNDFRFLQLGDFVEITSDFSQDDRVDYEIVKRVFDEVSDDIGSLRWTLLEAV